MRNKMRKLGLTAGLMVFNLITAVAQNNVPQVGNINRGLQEGVNTVKGLWGSVTMLLYVCCGMAACFGAWKVFSKWSNDDPDTTKTAAGWIGSLVFIFVAIKIIGSVFNME